MRENVLSPFGKGFLFLLVFLFGVEAVGNMASGLVPHPLFFPLAVFGFVLFFVAKLSVILWQRPISFGTGLMRVSMANLYRMGYWLMAVGVLAIFS